MEWRSHRFLKLIYVLSGAGRLLYAKRQSAFAAGDVILVPPQTPNRIIDDPTQAASLYVACLATSLFDFEPSLVPQLHLAAITGDGHFANRVASLMRRMVHRQRRSGSSRPIAMVADAMRLVQLVTAQTRSGNSRSKPGVSGDDRAVMRRYVSRLRNEFFEATTIEAAVAELDMPRRTFTKLFAEQTGDTWLQFVRRHAIDHAKRQLMDTEQPIASVAFECGFNDLSTFYRQFKSRVGISPAKYRRSFAKPQQAPRHAGSTE